MKMDPNRVQVSGPLAGYATGFCEELLTHGYPGERAARHLQLLAQLSRWLDCQGLGELDLSEQRVGDFLLARCADGYYDKPSLPWLLGLLGHVPGLEVARAVPPPPTSVELIVAEFADYLMTERGLAAGTIRGYRDVAELFLSHQAMPEGDLRLSSVTAESVTRFVVEQSRRRSAGAAQVSVTGLRSLLRFLFLQGRIEESLAEVVPAVSASKGHLPRGLAGETVAKLLAAVDGSTAIGRRDLAVLILLSRLGLRCGEVAGLDLDDIDWRHGEVVIRGKGARRDRLPLPVDVGEALAAYLHNGRPRTESRAVFLRVKAPITAMSASNVTSIVRRRCEGAGVPPAGAHRLRHSTATAMLRAGAPLAEIGQVLRQTHAATTAVYAKVDRVALRPLARPWPGASA
jgi:integrase/recombinase XerD